MEVNSIILSAGLSSRMGQAKALLRLPSNQTFLENLVQTFSTVSKTVVIVINSQLLEQIPNLSLPNNTKIIVNPVPNSTRLTSIKLAIAAINSTIPAFIHNVDTPMIQLSTLETLLKHYTPNAYIVPSYKGKAGHPILLPTKILTYIEKIADNTENLRDILKKFIKRTVDVNDWSITLNINTPEDLRNFLNKISH